MGRLALVHRAASDFVLLGGPCLWAHLEFSKAELPILDIGRDFGDQIAND